MATNVTTTGSNTRNNKPGLNGTLTPTGIVKSADRLKLSKKNTATKTEHINKKVKVFLRVLSDSIGELFAPGAL
jgi:hypothetical protein